jgi:hypothetical protein
VSDEALVIVGAEVAVVTVRVKDWVALLPIPLAAVMVIGYVPLVPAAAVPARVAVPLPLSVKVTPDGSVPDSVMAGVGLPVVVTWKLKGVRMPVLVEAPLVIAGAVSLVTVTFTLLLGALSPARLTAVT